MDQPVTQSGGQGVNPIASSSTGTQLIAPGIESSGQNSSAQETLISTQDGITTYSDTGDTSVSLAPPVLDHPDPYPDQGLGKVLERSYQLGSAISWGNSQPSGTLLQSYELPDAVLFGALAIPNYTEKLQNFQYFHAKMRLTVKVNATNYHYGRLIVAYLPCPYTHGGSITEPAAPHNRALCWLPLDLASAQSEKSITLDIPFRYPSALWNLSNPNYAIQAARVYIQVLHPLSSSNNNVTETARITTYFSFVDPRPIGLVTTHSKHPAKLKKRQYLRARIRRNLPQSSECIDAQVHGRRNGVYKKKTSTVSAEVDKKSRLGVVSGVSYDIADIGSRLSHIPVIGDIASTASSVFQHVGSIAETFGFAKPADINAPTRIYNNPMPELAQSRGLSQAARFTMDQGNHQNTNSDVYAPDCEDEMSWNTISRTPGLLKTMVTITGGSSGDIVWSAPTRPDYIPGTKNTSFIQFDPIPVNMGSLYCRYWRGSMKYTFIFSAGKFTTTRLRISYIPGFVWATPTVPTNVSGDIVSRVVDICGDCTVCVTIPYLSDQPYLPCLPTVDADDFDLAKESGSIVVSLATNPISVDNITAPVYMSVFAAGGEDMTFYSPQGLRDRGYTAGPPARQNWTNELTALFEEPPSLEDDFLNVDTHWNPRLEFSKTFPGLVECTHAVMKDVNFGESVDNVMDLLSRPVAIQSGDSAPDYLTSLPTAAVSNIFDFLPHMFRFCRIGLRFYIKATTELLLEGHFRTDSTAPYAANRFAGNVMAYNTVNPYVVIETHRTASTFFDITLRGNTWGDPIGALEGVRGSQGPRHGAVLSGSGSVSYMAFSDDSTFSFFQWPGYFLHEISFTGQPSKTTKNEETVPSIGRSSNRRLRVEPLRM